MSAQHDYDLANQAGAAFRADLNLCLAAVVGLNWGASAPATTFAYMLWADTGNDLLKQRNAANSAWISKGTLSATDWGHLSLAGGTMTGLLTLAAVTLSNAAITLGNSTTTAQRDTNATVKLATKNADATNSTSRAAVSAETSAITTALQSRHGDMGYVGTITNTKLGITVNDAAKGAVDTSGNFLWVKTASSFGGVGVELLTAGTVDVTADGARLLELNRLNSDGNLVDFYRDSVLVGAISVSSGTVTYGAFMGSHWAQLEDGAKDVEILRGTVMETIDVLCEWPGETNDRLPKVKVSDTAGSTRVYGVFTGWDMDEFRMVPVLEPVEVEDTRIEIVDGKARRIIGKKTVDARKVEVYGVVDKAGNPVMVKTADAVKDAKGRELEPARYEQMQHVVPVMRERQGTNDMHVAGLGASWVRIAKGATVKAGDLVESNGDGCARPQKVQQASASTIGKVTAAVKVEEYPDGSYLVPCVLYCG